MTAVTYRYVGAADGSTLAYRVLGSAGASTVILLHSLGADGHMWDPIAERLSHAHRVIVPDARGHGASGPAVGASVSVWVEDLHRVVEDADAEDVVLVGISLGGIQALAYTVAFSHAVRGLVVADSFAGLDPDVAHRKITGLTGQARAGSMATVAACYVADTFETPPPSGAESVRRAIAEMDADSYVSAVEACFLVDIVATLPKVKVPTRVLWGAADTKTPRPLSTQIVEGVQDGHLRVIPEAGHLSNVDNPGAFLSELTTFISALQSNVRAADEGAV